MRFRNRVFFLLPAAVLTAGLLLCQPLQARAAGEERPAGAGPAPDSGRPAGNGRTPGGEGGGAPSMPGVLGNATQGRDLSDPDTVPLPELEWSLIKPGLELGLARLPRTAAIGGDERLVILRIEPKNFDFGVHMASAEGTAYSLRGWAEVFGLEAGINASMYLPDNSTSTGLLRSPGHVNNPRAGSRLGAFFVAGPKSSSLPGADILERGARNLDKTLNRYGHVAQNYRLISGEGAILWPAGGSASSIAVVGKDNKGRMLFILSQERLPAHTFARYLLRFPLELGPVMYVEGGSPAGLFLFEAEGGQTARPGAVSLPVPGGVVHVWKGRQGMLNAKGNPEGPLPNIIGVRGRGE